MSAFPKNPLRERMLQRNISQGNVSRGNTEVIDLTADTDESAVEENQVSGYQSACRIYLHDPIIPMALHGSMAHFSFTLVYVYISPSSLTSSLKR